MLRRDFLKTLGAGAFSTLTATAFAGAAGTQKRLNVLLFTADDLGRDSLGCFGGKAPGLTPNLDAFAAEGMRFEYAHVTVAICRACGRSLATTRIQLAGSTIHSAGRCRRWRNPAWPRTRW